MDQSLNMVKIAYDALDDKLAEDIKIIDIRSISVLADYFIIADGNNKNQVPVSYTHLTLPTILRV